MHSMHSSATFWTGPALVSVPRFISYGVISHSACAGVQNFFRVSRERIVAFNSERFQRCMSSGAWRRDCRKQRPNRPVWPVRASSHAAPCRSPGQSSNHGASPIDTTESSPKVKKFSSMKLE